MKFRSYDSLKVFDAVARKQSMTAAATDLNLSKGSISYQINKLEENLGFALFERSNARLQLTENGRRIWNVSLNALQQIDQEIEDIAMVHEYGVTKRTPLPEASFDANWWNNYFYT